MSEQKNKKVFGSILIIIVLLIVGYLLYSYTKSPFPVVTSFDECVAAGFPVTDSLPAQCKTPDGRTFVGKMEGDWETFNDDATNASFQYPKTLSTKYISPVDWPPKLAVDNGPLQCTQAGSESDRAGQTSEVTIGNKVYCVTKVTEGAAGSTYTQYAYAFEKDGKIVILTFSLRFVQCGNYNDVEKAACEEERSSFDINGIVNQIADTVVLK
jgi:hypothetical protein